jgi:hypothetical protein
LGVEVGQANDALAGGALAEVDLHLLPGGFDLGGGHFVGIARVFTDDVVGHGTAHQGHFAQQATGHAAAEVLLDRTGDIRLRAEFTPANFTIKNSVGTGAVIANVIIGHVGKGGHTITPLGFNGEIIDKKILHSLFQRRQVGRVGEKYPLRRPGGQETCGVRKS